MSISQTVTIDGVSYQLSDYPTALVAAIEDELGSAVDYFEWASLTPDSCPQVMVFLRSGMQFRNGIPIRLPEPRWHSVGTVANEVSIDTHGQPSFSYSDDGSGANATYEAWRWCELYAEGDWHIRFTDAHHGNFHVWFGFDLADDEAAFLALNKGA